MEPSAQFSNFWTGLEGRLVKLENPSQTLSPWARLDYRELVLYWSTPQGDLGLNLDYEQQVRNAAFSWLNDITHYGRDSISYLEIDRFVFKGRHLRLMNPQGGIWKPKSFTGALSIRTGYTAPNKPPQYEDSFGSDGLLRVAQDDSIGTWRTFYHKPKEPVP